MILFYATASNKYTRGYHETCPDKIGIMLSPTSGYLNPRGIYAIDNGAFSKFNEKEFIRMLNKSYHIHKPLFVVCPDVLGCHDRTSALWNHYQPKIKKYKYPIAFVAQDGCEPELVPNNADWIFVGGKDPWKDKNIHKYIGLGKPVHVGRVNYTKRYNLCKALGVDSIDGSGFFRGDKVQLKLFIDHFKGE